MKHTILFWGSFLLLTFLYAPDSDQPSQTFTAKRSKKGPSIQSLKESCCEQFGMFLSQSSQLLTAIGRLQTHSIGALEGYMKGDKTAWCENASREKLAKHKQQWEQLNEKISQLSDLCNAIRAEL